MSRMRIALVGGLAAALLVVSAGSAMAAPPSSDTQNQTVQFTNRAAVQLTLDTPLVDFGNVDPLAQYAAGGGNATVKANAGWTLSMTAPANFTETGGGLEHDSDRPPVPEARCRRVRRRCLWRQRRLVRRPHHQRRYRHGAGVSPRPAVR